MRVCTYVCVYLCVRVCMWVWVWVCGRASFEPIAKVKKIESGSYIHSTHQ
jgi:hypothetical protein